MDAVSATRAAGAISKMTESRRCSFVRRLAGLDIVSQVNANPLVRVVALVKPAVSREISIWPVTRRLATAVALRMA
jgi:hypothetical protein